MQEGLALVVAEAMASGLPVVATENTGASEFIESGKSGIIVPAANADALSIAIVDLLDNPEKAREIGKEGAAHNQILSVGTLMAKPSKLPTLISYIHPM